MWHKKWPWLLQCQALPYCMWHSTYSIPSHRSERYCLQHYEGSGALKSCKRPLVDVSWQPSVDATVRILGSESPLTVNTSCTPFNSAFCIAALTATGSASTPTCVPHKSFTRLLPFAICFIHGFSDPQAINSTPIQHVVWNILGGGTFLAASMVEPRSLSVASRLVFQETKIAKFWSSSCCAAN